MDLKTSKHAQRVQSARPVAMTWMWSSVKDNMKTIQFLKEVQTKKEQNKNKNKNKTSENKGSLPFRYFGSQST